MSKTARGQAAALSRLRGDEVGDVVLVREAADKTLPGGASESEMVGVVSSPPPGDQLPCLPCLSLQLAVLCVSAYVLVCAVAFLA